MALSHGSLALLVVLILLGDRLFGRYIEEHFFRIFPIKNQQTELSALQRELLKEISRREQAERLANRAIAAANETHAARIRDLQKMKALERKSAKSSLVASYTYLSEPPQESDNFVGYGSSYKF